MVEAKPIFEDSSSCILNPGSLQSGQISKLKTLARTDRSMSLYPVIVGSISPSDSDVSLSSSSAIPEDVGTLSGCCWVSSFDDGPKSSFEHQETSLAFVQPLNLASS